MKPSSYCFGLLAVGLIVYAAFLPRSGPVTSSPQLPAYQSAQAPLARSKPTSPSALPTSPAPLAASPETDLAARHRKEREERRLRQEDQRRDIQRSIEEVAARQGISTNTAQELWEIARDPSAAQRQEDAYRAQQRKEDLAQGVRVELWKRDDELERLSAYLRNGMSLQEVKQLFGSASKAQSIDRIPVLPGLADQPKGPGKLFDSPILSRRLIPLDQVDQFQGPLRVFYTPHPTGANRGMGDTYRDLHLDFNVDKVLTGFRYQVPSW